MSSSSAAKKPKLPQIDLVIKSISEIKRDYSKIESLLNDLERLDESQKNDILAMLDERTDSLE